MQSTTASGVRDLAENGLRVDRTIRPKVSVAMVAFKHEKFIAQATESVMMQKTAFPLELVVGEDCSPDGTRGILQELQRKYPGRIRLLLPEKNLGMMQNFIQTLRACRGDYVALLEGDDFWTSPHKLQAQVDFLEANQDCSACFTLTRVIREGDPSAVSYIPAQATPGRRFATDELLGRNCMATCSLLFRNVIAELSFQPICHLPMIDWPLNVLLSLRGPIGYLDQEMAAYRQHEGGVWTRARELAKLEGALRMFEALLGILPAKFAPQVKAKIIKSHQLIALEHLREGERKASFFATCRSLLAIPWPSAPRYGWYLKRSMILFLGTLGLPVSGVERHLSK